MSVAGHIGEVPGYTHQYLSIKEPDPHLHDHVFPHERYDWCFRESLHVHAKWTRCDQASSVVKLGILLSQASIDRRQSLF